MAAFSTKTKREFEWERMWAIFDGGHICPAGNVGAARKKHSVIAKNPFGTIVRKYCDVFSRAKPKMNERGSQRKTILVEFPVRNRLIGAGSILRGESGQVIESFCSLAIELGQSACGDSTHA